MCLKRFPDSVGLFSESEMEHLSQFTLQTNGRLLFEVSESSHDVNARRRLPQCSLHDRVYLTLFILILYNLLTDVVNISCSSLQVDCSGIG